VLRVGITGGIGTGKSTVCAILRVLGVPVLDSDSVAKEIIENNSTAQRQISLTFGEDIFNHGKLNKGLLASRAFESSDKIKLLNSIVHPIVAQESEKWFTDQQAYRFAVKEAALLIESGSHHSVDCIIGVIAPLETRIKRLLASGRFSTKHDIEQRIKQQMPEEEKQKLYTFTIHNSDASALLPQLWPLYNKLCALHDG
jgi:dephospho-CoA kinase